MGNMNGTSSSHLMMAITDRRDANLRLLALVSMGQHYHIITKLSPLCMSLK